MACPRRWGLLLILCCGLLACGRNQSRDERTGNAGAASSSTTTGPGEPGRAARQQYPAQVQKGFLEQCTAGGGTDAVCRCTLEKVEERYTLFEFGRLANEMAKAGRLNDELIVFVNACRAETG